MEKSVEHFEIAIGRDLRVTSWNAAAERLMDRPASEAIGAALMTMVAPAHRLLAGHMLQRALAGDSIRHELTLMRRDGSEVVVSAALAPSQAAGQPTGLVIVGEEVAAGTATETVLVVEDETAVRNIVVRGLRARGYDVLEATHGEDALLVAERHNAPIHLVVTDVVMPNMSGTELFHTLRRWYPRMRVLFISGYARSAIPPEALREGQRAAFLAKPFTVEQLVTEAGRLIRATRETEADI